MNDVQLKNAIEHFDAIEYGIPNAQIRDLGLRPFVKRVQRYVNKKQISLYNWKPEWLSYIREQKNEHELIEDIPEILKELSSRNITVSPISTSSLVSDETKRIEEPYLDKYAKEIFESLTQGPCHLRSIFDRVLLLRCFYKRLISGGMTSSEIINYDLYGMIHHYLIETKDERYCIKNKAKIHFEYFINKYYQRDINEYLQFVLNIYKEYKGTYGIIHLTNIPVYIYNSLREISKRVRTRPLKEEFLNSFNVKYGIDFKSLTDLKLAAKFFDNENFEIGNYINFLNTAVDDMDVLIEFEPILKQERRNSIVTLISRSYEKMNKNESNISIDLNILAHLYYIIVEVYESNNKIEITKEMVYDKLLETNTDEVSSIVSEYLHSYSVGFKL